MARGVESQVWNEGTEGGWCTTGRKNKSVGGNIRMPTMHSGEVACTRLVCPKRHAEVLNPRTSAVTLFGNKVIAVVLQLIFEQRSWDGGGGVGTMTQLKICV